MDYEQKYKEALERAKDILSYKEVRQEDMEYLFPELAESEDERIRKAIKYCIKQGFIGCGKIENVTPDECLAWLEKQGEQKPMWIEEDEDSSVNDETNAPTEYGKYVDECLNDASKHFFSEGEDKYSVADLFYAGVRCGKSCLEKQVESKKVDLELNSFDATVCKIGSTYLKEMDRDAIAKALEPYKDGDKVKVIIKAKGE